MIRNALVTLALWWLRRCAKSPRGTIYGHIAGPTPDRLGPSGRVGRFFAQQFLCTTGNGTYSLVLRGKTPEEVCQAVREYSEQR